MSNRPEMVKRAKFLWESLPAESFWDQREAERITVHEALEGRKMALEERHRRTLEGNGIKIVDSNIELS